TSTIGGSHESFFLPIHPPWILFVALVKPRASSHSTDALYTEGWFGDPFPMLPASESSSPTHKIAGRETRYRPNSTPTGAPSSVVGNVASNTCSGGGSCVSR